MKSIIYHLIILIPIVLIIILINWAFPIGFTGYILACAALLLLYAISIRRNKNIILTRPIVSWAVICTLSLLVTINYLHPAMKVYNNSDYHIVQIDTVEFAGADVLLVDSRHPQKAFFDDETYSGIVKATIGDGGNIILNYNNCPSLPIFINEGLQFRQVNESLPVFNHSIEFKKDSVSVNIAFDQFFAKRNLFQKILKKIPLSDKLPLTKNFIEEDNLNVIVSTKTPTSYTVDTSSFHKIIRSGLSLDRLVRGDISYSNAEVERLVSFIDDVTLMRASGRETNKFIPDTTSFCFTLPPKLLASNIDVIVDGQPIDLSYGANSFYTIEKGQHLRIGFGQNSTDRFFLSSRNGKVLLTYRLPLMRNFPKLDASSPLRNHVAITSDKMTLLGADVNQAFLFDLFNEKDNIHHFEGSIVYTADNSTAPLNYQILAKEQLLSNDASNIIWSADRTAWHFAVCNMRETNPVTGLENRAVSDNNQLLAIGILALFVLILIIFGSGNQSYTMFGIWLLLIPIIVIRLYLQWRVAVFPPVEHISRNVFLNYTMAGGPMDNFNLWTWVIIISLGVVNVSIVSVIPLFRKLLCRLRNRYPHLCEKFQSIQLAHNKRGGQSLRRTSKLVFWITLFLGYAALSLTIYAAHIALPVIIFILVEWYSIGKKSVKFRLFNAIWALLVIFVSDPGYSIMFLVFLCIYYLLFTEAYNERLWSLSIDLSKRKTCGNLIVILLISIVGMLVLFFPLLAPQLFKSSSSVFGIPPRFIIFGLIGVFIAFAYSRLSNNSSHRFPKWPIGALVLVFTIGVPLAFGALASSKQHFKYRALIQSETVDKIMMDETFDSSGSEHLLAAAENQWFLEYYGERGKKIIPIKTSRPNEVTRNGIISLAPHSQICVPWNTQISDVIVSRFVAGELSWLVPLLMILLGAAFIVFVLRIPNQSGAAKSGILACALLIVIQMFFVWMAVTNRMIFFGQDFPLLSLTAHGTLLMFVVLCILMIYFSSLQSKSDSLDETLGEGYESLSVIKREEGITNKIGFFRQYNILHLISLSIILIFVLLGNPYKKLYGNSDPIKFNLKNTIAKAEQEIEQINSLMDELSIPGSLSLKENEDVSAIMARYDAEINLSNRIDELRANNRIGKFTYSLYKAFRKNLQKKNSQQNIIHLRHITGDGVCRFDINNGFYTLTNPEAIVNKWSGNIYASDKARIAGRTIRKVGSTGMLQIPVPESWTRDGQLYDLLDCRVDTSNYSILKHADGNSYHSNSYVIPIEKTAFVEINEKKHRGGKSRMTTVSLKKEEPNLLMKNMIVNGRPQSLYPLGKSLYWIKEYTELLSAENDSLKVSGDIVINLDKQLAINTSVALGKAGNIACSMVAVDGDGNVRALSEHRPFKYELDPNDEEMTLARSRELYLNPIAKEQNFTFGNLNLILMSPGPGSSLKPITYAAVTSQISNFPWESLKLESVTKEIKKDGAKGKERIRVRTGKYSLDVAKFEGKYTYISRFASYLYAYDNINSSGRFRSINGDEDGLEGNGVVNNHDYLRESSNFYNALVTYLGNLPYEKFRHGKDSILVDYVDGAYPMVTVNNGGYLMIKKTAVPDPDRKTCPLNEGLSKNFNLPTALGDEDKTRTSFTGTTIDYSKMYSFAYPQKPSAYNKRLQEVGSEASRLKRYTLGSDPVKVTPLKMAAMYGALFSLNPNFCPTVKNSKQMAVGEWSIGERKKRSDMLSFYINNIYAGMYECANSSSGTAHGSFNGVILPANFKAYAKTGTLNGVGGIDDHLLSVVITNGKEPDEKEYRFYVMYFRFAKDNLGKSDRESIISDIINDVLKSDTFKQYMNI